MEDKALGGAWEHGPGAEDELALAGRAGAAERRDALGEEGGQTEGLGWRGCARKAWNFKWNKQRERFGKIADGLVGVLDEPVGRGGKFAGECAEHGARDGAFEA